MSVQTDDGCVERFRSVLSADEIERAERFRSPHLQRSFVVVRGTLRVLLAAYAGRPPESLRFSYGSTGKPRLSEGAIDFNLSHSGDFALFAFASGCEVGVDLEKIRDVPEMEDIVRRLFRGEEGNLIMAAGPEERRRAFFSRWVEVEARVKAAGLGLASAWDGFLPDAPGPAAATSIEEGYLVEELDLIPGYAAALAYSGAPRPVRVQALIEPREVLRRSGLCR